MNTKRLRSECRQFLQGIKRLSKLPPEFWNGTEMNSCPSGTVDLSFRINGVRLLIKNCRKDGVRFYGDRPDGEVITGHVSCLTVLDKEMVVDFLKGI